MHLLEIVLQNAVQYDLSETTVNDTKETTPAVQPFNIQVLLKTRVHSKSVPSFRVRTTLLEKAAPPSLTVNLAN